MPRLRPLVSLLALMVLLVAAPPAPAQESPAPDLLTVEKYLDFEGVSDPRISPDGSRVVYTRSRVDRMNDRTSSDLWIMTSDGARNRFLTEGTGVRWSPDGTRIAFLKEDDQGRTQIFVRWIDAEGAVSQVTRVNHAPANLRWSPDGSRIAFTRLVPSDEPGWRIDMPSPPEGAEWTEPPREVDRRHFRQDFQGFLPEGDHHLFVVPAEGGTPRQLTEGPGKVGPPIIGGLHFGVGLDWTPDGETIVFDGLLEAYDDTYLESHVYAVDVAGGDVRQLTSERGPWSAPVVSPDGRTVAYTGFPWTNQTYRATDLYVMEIDGSSPRKISGDLDRDPGSLTWSEDGDGVYFTAGNEGSQNVWFAPADGGGPRQVTEGEHMLSLSSVASGGTAVGTRTSPHEPGDVVRYSLDRFRGLTELTRVNDDVLHGVRLGEVEEVWYGSTDDTRVQGWIVKPPDFDPSNSYPLILHIHGGPHAMYNVGFSYSYQNFAANGYLVLYTNPRGSTGYGTEFGNAIDNGYPSVDYEDLMAGVDEVVGRGYVDEERMFVTGCSGGGVLSSWVIGHTDRFAAAGVRCPVINWMSFAGTADIPRWGYERYEGYPWTNPEKYLEHSPLMYVENVTTPTVIMTGELDLRTPMSQSEEYYQALKAVGVPTTLLRFHGEYHGTGSRPSNFMRTQLYLMSWFERWGDLDPTGSSRRGSR